MISLITDKPAIPQGPLLVHDVTKSTAVLTWRKPIDDGGSHISHYLVEKQNVARGTWTEAGTSPDLSFTVHNLDAMKEYHFRVKAVNSEGESEALATDKPVLAKNPYGE